MNSTFSAKYPAAGIYTLVDGVKGSESFKDGKWQGYEGSDIDVIIDLGEVKKINRISANFLRDINSYLFLPESVEYSVSDNSEIFSESKKIKNDTQQNENKVLIKTFEFKPEDTKGRFIHLTAKNIGKCPEWHKGAGSKAWLFADEIIIE